MKALIKNRGQPSGVLEYTNGRNLNLKLAIHNRERLKEVFFVLEQYLKDLGYSVVKKPYVGTSGLKSKEYLGRLVEKNKFKRGLNNK